MNAYHAGVGQQDAVDWSPAGFARSVAMMAVGDVLGKAHVKRLGKLDQVDNARRLVGQSPALLRRAGEGARYFVSEVGAFSALGVCEALIREGKLDNAWQIVEGNIQFMLAMRMWRGVETGALRAARATYVKEPTAANLQRVVKEFETVVGKAEGTKDTLSGAAARQNPIPSGGKAAAVVGPEGQKVERRVDAKEGEVNAPDVAKDPAVELFLSYRATKSWSEMIDFAKTLPEPLAKAPLVREQLALALNRAGRGEEAERILLDLIGERGPKSETYGILGRIYKDRFEVAAKNDDSPAAGRWLEKSIDAYLKGFEADPQDAYPGINAVTLMELTQPADPRRAQILPVVQGAVERKITTSAPGYWDVATVLELAVLAKDQGKAVQALGAALRAAHEPWEAETTARNLRLIREARERRNESVVWAEQIESQLQARAGI
ncbi:MAG: DUF4071 domain-containing protein [Deltaproteobacteria bacterium]|nr:DUF4071 domain-containing protein [Deltaproteobacteria bacterium]